MKNRFKYIFFFLGCWVVLHTIVIFFVGWRADIGSADIILVFGNRVEESGVPSPRLQSRLDAAVVLYKKWLAPRIFVSWGFGKEGWDEATVMKKYLITHGIPDSAVTEDGNGNDTYQTVRNLYSLFAGDTTKKVIVVSQYYHILRVKYTMYRFWFHSVYSFAAKMFPERRDWYAIPREIIGYYSYIFKDYEK